LVEDHFVPNGCFGDANCSPEVVTIDGHGCDDKTPSIQGVCRRYTYKPLVEGTPGHLGYLGVLFQDVAPNGENDIGRVPGVPVQAGAKRVVFWSKVESGSVLVHFRAGGANNWEGQTDPALPYKDDFGVPLDATLTPEFQQLSIDLGDVSYEDVVSPFGWAIVTKGSTTEIAMDIADVRWE